MDRGSYACQYSLFHRAITGFLRSWEDYHSYCQIIETAETFHYLEVKTFDIMFGTNAFLIVPSCSIDMTYEA